MQIFKTEPALIIGFVTAVVILLVAFGVPVTPEQSDAIIGVVAAALTLGAALATRQAVTPNGKVAARETKDGTLVSGPADGINPDGTPVKVSPDEAAI